MSTMLQFYIFCFLGSAALTIFLNDENGKNDSSDADAASTRYYDSYSHPVALPIEYSSQRGKNYIFNFEQLNETQFRINDVLDVYDYDIEIVDIDKVKIYGEEYKFQFPYHTIFWNNVSGIVKQNHELSTKAPLFQTPLGNITRIKGKIKIRLHGLGKLFIIRNSVYIPHYNISNAKINLVNIHQKLLRFNGDESFYKIHDIPEEILQSIDDSITRKKSKK